MTRRAPINRRRANPRRGPARDRAYLAWIRRFGCVACLNSTIIAPKNPLWDDIEAAHVGPIRGLGQKCSDYETIPLCEQHHRLGRDSQHRLQKKFFDHHGLDRAALISELNSRYREGMRVA